MPVTFGSVGDIISVSLLIKDLLVALDDSRGSSDSYRAIIRELYTLDSALLHVDQLSRTHNATAELHGLCTTARQTVDRCRECIDKFKLKIQKYKRSLATGGSGKTIGDTARKIQWSVSEKQHLMSFRAELTGYTESINMLIATASVYVHPFILEKACTNVFLESCSTSMPTRPTAAWRARYGQRSRHNSVLLQRSTVDSMKIGSCWPKAMPQPAKSPKDLNG